MASPCLSPKKVADFIQQFLQSDSVKENTFLLDSAKIRNSA